ncbi:MAG: L,D-transpeptidase [Lactobacillus sp.]|nr:L,D-transpeptidase [Lactobacillus sp.]
MKRNHFALGLISFLAIGCVFWKTVKADVNPTEVPATSSSQSEAVTSSSQSEATSSTTSSSSPSSSSTSAVVPEKTVQKFKNVSIYGVNVSGLTVDQAYSKINKQAANYVYIDSKKKVSYKHSNKISKIISKKTVQSYYNKQAKVKSSVKKIIFTNTKLSKLAKSLKKKYYNVTATYKIDGDTYHFYSKNYIKSISATSTKNVSVSVDTAGIRKRLNLINSSEATLTKFRFKAPVGKKTYGKTVTLTNVKFGWDVRKAGLTDATQAVNKAFSNGKNTTYKLKAKYTYGKSYNGTTGYNRTNKGIGKNYVIVSLSKQRLWVVKNGKVVANFRVVTGEVDKHQTTPKGVHYLLGKQTNATLTGPGYSCVVKRWMPFTLDGCGLHDAYWRSNWSKKAYIKDGSHGCVNIRPSQIDLVWNNVKTGEPVIVY